ncbi:MAG: adenine deaminase C-terminal domain-containing protein, partial [Candidatus Bipolaricaulota bacterium]
VAGDVGSIGPGRFADILIVSDLETLAIECVLAAGDVVAEGGTLSVSIGSFQYPESAKNSVKIPEKLTASDFLIRNSGSQDRVRCRVIEIIENQVTTRGIIEDCPVVNGIVKPSDDSAISLLAIVERHSGSGRISRGFVKGYGLTGPYGLASTVAHDSQNLLVMGSDRELMAQAANRVVEMDGGICLARIEGVCAEIPLPIAGLMSEEPVEIVAEQADRLHQELRSLGCAVDDALMSFFFLALPVIPELRLTDLGLVDVDTFEIVPLIVAEDNQENKER